jgi:hypothetical protein
MSVADIIEIINSPIKKLFITPIKPIFCHQNLGFPNVFRSLDSLSS